MRTLHDKVTSFIKKQKHYRKEQLRDFLLNYRLRFRRLWSVVEATVEVIGLELGQQPLRASVALKDLYNVLYKPLYNTLYLQ